MTELHSFIRFQVVGIHYWEDAPDRLAYLKCPHRHVFHFEVTFPQSRDRGIEFHEFASYAEDLISRFYPKADLPGRPYNFQGRSCEMIATALARHILAGHQGIPYVSVAVSEDGECGSTCTMSVADLV